MHAKQLKESKNQEKEYICPDRMEKGREKERDQQEELKRVVDQKFFKVESTGKMVIMVKEDTRSSC